MTEDGARYADAMGSIEMLSVRACLMADASRQAARQSINIVQAILIGWVVLMAGIVAGIATGGLDRAWLDAALDWKLAVLLLVPMYFEGKAQRLSQVSPQWRELSDTAVVHVQTTKSFPVGATPADWAEERLTALRARMVLLLSITPSYVYDFIEDVEDELVGDDDV